MLKATFSKLKLKFHVPARTSRGVLTEKTSWIISLFDPRYPENKGTGECSIIQDLSPDKLVDYEDMLMNVCNDPGLFITGHGSLLRDYPSIRFGLEMAYFDLMNGGKRLIFKSDFTEGKAGIPINGLIWMGSKASMLGQIKARIEEGYLCIKLKIGTLPFDDELNLLKKVRADFGSHHIQLRIDANGAFSPKDAADKLKRLADFDIHSIEQPVKPGLWEAMAYICNTSPIPIALDEELFYSNAGTNKLLILQTIKPQFLVLKPTMLGGYAQTLEWINHADELGVGWWITSALESNVGLNAIAQWTYVCNNPAYHGLGTGKLFENNLPTNLYIENGSLKHQP